MRENQTRAFLWTSKEGKKSVQDLLAKKGELLSGWALAQATKITRNGRVLVEIGEYRAPGSTPQKRVWRVFLGGKIFNPFGLYSLPQAAETQGNT